MHFLTSLILVPYERIRYIEEVVSLIKSSVVTSWYKNHDYFIMNMSTDDMTEPLQY